MDAPRVKLGELLVRAGLITSVQLQEALDEQSRNGKRLGSLLVESGLVSETQVTQILSQQLSVPWVSLHHIDFSRELLALVPVDVVERFCLIPIYVRRVRGLGDALYVAMDDPTNQQALEEVAKRSNLHVRAMIAPPHDIRSAIRAYYGVGEPSETNLPRPTREDEEEEISLALRPKAAKPKPEVPPRVVPPPKPDLAALAASDGATKSRGPTPPDATSSARRANVPDAPPPLRSAASADASPQSRSAASADAPSQSRSAASADAPSQSRSAASADAPSQSRSAASADAPASSKSGSLVERARLDPKAARKLLALTLLDGTTIRVPQKSSTGDESGGAAAPSTEEQLTARDLVAALRVAARGGDATDVLGENARWESMLAALISVLLKKHLIADWEFIEEFKKG
jgi:type IV pilus assembly protein PilB